MAFAWDQHWARLGGRRFTPRRDRPPNGLRQTPSTLPCIYEPKAATRPPYSGSGSCSRIS